jgi:hypothetical protein
LIGGIRGATVRAAEEGEAGDLAEDVINAERRAGDDIVLREQDCAAGGFRKANGSAGCRNRDLFVRSGGFEHDIDDSMKAGSPRALGRSEPRGADFYGPGLRGHGHKAEVSAGVG